MAERVSVVVPTIGRMALLERCLRGLAAQRYQGFDVVIVHHGIAEVVDLVERWSDRLTVEALAIAERDAVSKRNAGWRHRPHADVIAFTDDDCEPSPTWLEAAVRTVDAGADLVQGAVVPHPDDASVSGPFARTIRADRPSHDYPGANFVFRRDALVGVDGFDPDFWGGGEDTDLAWRVIERGGRSVFDGEAMVWHAVRDVGFTDHLRSLPRWQTMALLVRRHPQLRRHMTWNLFWKKAHRTAALALVGLLISPFDRRGLALAVPHVLWRARHRGWKAAPQLAVADVAEVAVLATGSVRYGSVLL